MQQQGSSFFFYVANATNSSFFNFEAIKENKEVDLDELGNS